MTWYQLKEALSLASGLSMDALHVHAGIVGQVGVALVLRRTLASPLPWLAVLAAALANEWSDLSFDIWPNRQDQYDESVRDIWNTMLMPTLLLLIARFAPHLVSARDALPAAEDIPSGSGR